MSGAAKYIGLGVLIFLAAMVLDVATTRYVLAANAGKAHQAARYSSLMWAVSMVGTVAVLKVDLALAIWEVCGLYVGSWYAVSTAKSRKPEDDEQVG